MIRAVDLKKPPIPAAQRSLESSEWARLCRLVGKATGLDLRQYRPDSLQRRVKAICRSKGFVRTSDLLAWLDQDKANAAWMVDRLAINVSEVFRDPERWDDLRRRVLPHLMQESPALKAWSAGCSGGAEAFSLGMILREDWPGGHSILGTDIDESVLAKARAGQLETYDVARLPEETRDRHMSRVAGNSWQVHDEVRAMTRFERNDLLREPLTGPFDLIICRNVAIYFKNEAKHRLYESLMRALRPGGVLFLGSAERIYAADPRAFDSFGTGFYLRRPNSRVKEAA